MPIKLMHTGRGAGPVIVCDYCEQRIENASEGNYIWNDEDVEAGSLMDVYFVHSTRQCDEGLQHKLGKVMDNSVELSILIPFLIDNLSVDLDKARQGAEWSAEEIG